MSPEQIPFKSDDTASSLSSMNLVPHPQSSDISDIHARFTNTHETPEIDIDPSDSSSDAPKPEKRFNSRARAKRMRKTSSNPSIPTPTLRPANDILSRIRHDPTLDASDYIIGYHDRIEGIMEMKVEDWKGGDVTDEEFIPQHRILYFRRGSDGVRVWDRKRRLDGVFGSGAPGGLVDEGREEGKSGDIKGEIAQAEDEGNGDGVVEVDPGHTDTKGQRAQDVESNFHAGGGLPNPSPT
jgi:uncharacterized protein (UPF0248 family)